MPYFRQIILNRLVGHAGCVVEIDESKFGKRTYNRGIERGTNNIFMKVVHTRDAATLFPIIQRCVKPGTQTITDEWSSYQRLSTVGFTHQTVNRSLHFVNPTTGAHTQNIEGTWRLAKRKLKRGSGTSSLLFTGYLIEFMWRKKYGEEFAFSNFY